MQEHKFLKIVWEYGCDRIKVLACLLCMEGIAFFALWLQGAQFNKVSYAVFLSGFVLLLIGIGDFANYWKRRSKLGYLKKSISYDVSELAEGGSFFEADYQELVKILFEKNAMEESEGAYFKKEMLDFYSLWVHQIKTPISGMRLLLQAQKDGLIAGEADSKVLNDWNKTISMELFRVEQYVDMVLSFLRMEDMGKDLVLCEYKVDAVVNQAVKKFSKEFIYRKIKLEKGAIDIAALTDEKWLLLVLEQLLSNALKYTPEQGIIRIYGVKGRNVLVIEDTGIGIRAEDMPRVCEKGFTGYNGREDKKSTGIGLYLCKNIMDRLNHGFEITSQVGTGTAVYLNFEREKIEIE